MSKNEEIPELTLKSFKADLASVTIIDDEKGIAEAYVAGIGNKDSVADIIEPGAFVDSLKVRKPKGVWSHDWNRPVSKTLEIYEVPAGDPRLPQKMIENGIGGLYVKTQFNLETEDGRNAFSWVKFYDDDSEWSIGYQVKKQEFDTKAKAMRLKEIDLFEYSPVLFGANPLTATVGVKVHNGSGSEGSAVELKVQGVDEEMSKKIADAVEAIVGEKTAEDEVTPPVDPAVVAEGGTVEDDVEPAEVPVEVVPAVPTDVDVEAVEEAANTPVPEPEGDEKGQEPEAAKPHAIVDLVKTLCEAAELSRDDVASISGFAEAAMVDEKVMVGSFEDTRRKLQKALKACNEGYCWIHSIFDSKIVYACEGSWKTDYESKYYEATYSIKDGEVTLGDPVEVDVVEVVVAKSALIDAAFKGHASVVKTLLQPLVDVSAEAEGDVEVKTAIETSNKAGASISAANVQKIKDAIETLESLLGVEDVEDDAVEEADEKGADAEIESKGEEAPADPAKADEASDTAEAKSVESFDLDMLAEFEALEKSLVVE